MAMNLLLMNCHSMDVREIPSLLRAVPPTIDNLAPKSTYPNALEVFLQKSKLSQIWNEHRFLNSLPGFSREEEIKILNHFDQYTWIIASDQKGNIFLVHKNSGRIKRTTRTLDDLESKIHFRKPLYPNFKENLKENGISYSIISLLLADISDFFTFASITFFVFYALALIFPKMNLKKALISFTSILLGVTGFTQSPALLMLTVTFAFLSSVIYVRGLYVRDPLNNYMYLESWLLIFNTEKLPTSSEAAA